MTRPNTTFEKPEWPLIADPVGARFYANVDNRVARHYSNGRIKDVPVVVPTDLFTFMREVLKIDPVEDVQLYLVPDDKFYVLGMTWGEKDTNVTDLWAYTATSLPAVFK